MKGKAIPIVALLALSTLAAISPLDARANPMEEIAQMKAGQTRVEGVVTQMKSGLYTVKTATGTNYTLAESGAVRYGRDVPKVGDEMILWINEGNDILDASKKETTDVSPHYMSGKLISINYGRSQITLSRAGGEERFELRPESRMFRDFAVGTPVTIGVNKEGEVIDIQVAKDSNVPRLSDPDSKSALKGYRHLGKPE
ncbi:MAG TPA: hypothetical protein VN638_12450 [Nitrospiraceae bacterium]|nr:hypothetical protein [Nitrospiraceae bacterium]